MTDNSRPSMVFDHIRSIAAGHFDRWDAWRAGISTAEELRRHQLTIAAKLELSIGGLPNGKTPLNDRVTGRLDREHYRIEKVIFESLPKFPVTGNLYLPKQGVAPYPVVLAPCGHTVLGKAGETYQRVNQHLARLGFAVFSYDPLGQGERAQYYDPELGDSRIGRSVREHEYAGHQSLLVGHNLARHRIWDGIRAIDYLASRDDIDIDRLACAGCSGGGTVATYLAVLEPRIKAAVVVCYTTARRAWLDTGELADAEQVQDGAIEGGVDHADLLAAFAPRPLLVCCGTRDFFPVAGTRWTVERVRRLYELLGAGDRVDIHEADLGHGYQASHRLATGRWLARWLLDEESATDDTEDPPVESEEDLYAAPGGQTANLGSRTVFSFTMDEAARLAESRAIARTDSGSDARPSAARLTDLLRIPSGSPRWRRSDGGITVAPEPGIELDGVLIEASGAGPPVLRPTIAPFEGTTGESIASDDRKATLTLELRGSGSSKPVNGKNHSHEFTGEHGYLFYQYGMVGRSYLGARVMDVLAGSTALREVSGSDESWIEAQGSACLAAIMAAVLDPAITGLILIDRPPSYHEIATTEYYDLPCEWFVPGILAVTDISDLMSVLRSRGVSISERQSTPETISAAPDD